MSKRQLTVPMPPMGGLALVGGLELHVWREIAKTDGQKHASPPHNAARGKKLVKQPASPPHSAARGQKHVKRPASPRQNAARGQKRVTTAGRSTSRRRGGRGK